MGSGIRTGPVELKKGRPAVCECSHRCYGGAVSEKREMMEAELVRLEGLLADLEKDWQKVPYAFVLLIGAIPAYMKYGTLGSSVTILAVVSLVATSYYLIGVRKAEYRGEMEEIRMGMERLAALEASNA